MFETIICFSFLVCIPSLRVPAKSQQDDVMTPQAVISNTPSTHSAGFMYNLKQFGSPLAHHQNIVAKCYGQPIFGALVLWLITRSL